MGLHSVECCIMRYSYVSGMWLARSFSFVVIWAFKRVILRARAPWQRSTAAWCSRFVSDGRRWLSPSRMGFRYLTLCGGHIHGFYVGDWGLADGGFAPFVRGSFHFGQPREIWSGSW